MSLCGTLSGGDGRLQDTRVRRFNTSATRTVTALWRVICTSLRRSPVRRRIRIDYVIGSFDKDTGHGTRDIPTLDVFQNWAQPPFKE
jgi:hypothetical protein